MVMTEPKNFIEPKKFIEPKNFIAEASSRK
jgi:hypothetical protein